LDSAINRSLLTSFQSKENKGYKRNVVANLVPVPEKLATVRVHSSAKGIATSIRVPPAGCK
jgi:hypothetical protein